jgi:uncharacterized damage-inducible protein DinB
MTEEDDVVVVEGSMSQVEAWLRGPVPAIPALLQPVAHGLLQCREEMSARVAALTPEQMWARPAGAASVGFHARHAAGSLDRLFTYARGEQLSPAQQAALAAEEQPDLAPEVANRLVTAFDDAVERALAQLRTTDETTLLDTRGVGRARLPSTVIGLLFHAAEHAQRHVGQLVTTAKMLSVQHDYGVRRDAKAPRPDDALG